MFCYSYCIEMRLVTMIKVIVEQSFTLSPKQYSLLWHQSVSLVSIVASHNNERSNNLSTVNFFALLTAITNHHNTEVANCTQGLHVTHDTGWFARDGGILTPDPNAAAPPLRLTTLPPPPHNPLIRRTAHTPNSQTEVHTRAHFTITLDCMFICV